MLFKVGGRSCVSSYYTKWVFLENSSQQKNPHECCTEQPNILVASRGYSGSTTLGILEAKMNPLEHRIAIVQIPCRKADFVGFADVNLGLFAFPGAQQGMEPKEANWGG